MRIVAIRSIVSPIRSNIANAYIDFSQMTASVVAVVTDVKVDGKPVVGYGFNSNGRYAQHGLLNERFIKRASEAKPDSLLGDEGQREAGRARRALGRGRRDRHGDLGRHRQGQARAAVEAAERPPQRRPV